MEVKTEIEIERIEELVGELVALNQLDLDEIAFFENGVEVDIPPAAIRKFELMGFANQYFVTMRFWEDYTDPPKEGNDG